MKTKLNEEFSICPKWEDCFVRVFPINLKIGSIFSKKTYVHGGEKIHQKIRRVTKIEPLRDHPDHIVISSILVGAIVSREIYEKLRKTFYGDWVNETDEGKSKIAVIEYYDEDHLECETCVYHDDREETEVFFISTNEKEKYYSPDIKKIKHLKVPVSDDMKVQFLGYW